MSIVNDLLNAFVGVEFSMKDAYKVCPDVNPDSVRARIYEHLGVEFEKLGKNLYITKDKNCVLIEGDGRNLSMLNDSSIDCIITDHPWSDPKSNKGGNRAFAAYDCFQYTVQDFQEKARVLKNGSFLVEMLPAENNSNFDYLYQIKKMAQAAGFEYYCKVPWVKGSFVSNTGRNAKNFEDVMIFSKGKARALKPDKQRAVVNGTPTQFMSGTTKMLPTEFNVQGVSSKNRLCCSEKPSELFEQLLEYITLENEIVLDQFSGSGSVGEACLHKNRKCILFEKSKDQVNKIIDRLSLQNVTLVGNAI